MNIQKLVLKIYSYTVQKESKENSFDKYLHITAHNFNRKQEISKSCKHYAPNTYTDLHNREI